MRTVALGEPVLPLVKLTKAGTSGEQVRNWSNGVRGSASRSGSAPGNAMAAQRKQRGKPQVLKIYSAIGKTSEEGHNFVYSAVDRWETDVFKFLDANVH